MNSLDNFLEMVDFDDVYSNNYTIMFCKWFNLETNSRGIVRERAKLFPMMVTIVSFHSLILLLMTLSF